MVQFSKNRVRQMEQLQASGQLAMSGQQQNVSQLKVTQKEKEPLTEGQQDAVPTQDQEDDSSKKRDYREPKKYGPKPGQLKYKNNLGLETTQDWKQLKYKKAKDTVEKAERYLREARKMGKEERFALSEQGPVDEELLTQFESKIKQTARLNGLESLEEGEAITNETQNLLFQDTQKLQAIVRWLVSYINLRYAKYAVVKKCDIVESRLARVTEEYLNRVSDANLKHFQSRVKEIRDSVEKTREQVKVSSEMKQDFLYSGWILVLDTPCSKSDREKKILPARKKMMSLTLECSPDGRRMQEAENAEKASSELQHNLIRNIRQSDL